MPSLSSLLAVAAIIGFFAAVLFVVFGQIIARKLRKNPDTKERLGIEFISGWDIINVAQALSIPKAWRRKLESSPLSELYANSEILYEHTTRTDRILAATFYWLLTISGLTMIMLVILDSLGLFE